MIKAALIAILLATCAFAADDALVTLNMRNGYFWAQLADTGDYRQAFLMGMMDGWDLRGYSETDVKESTARAMDRSGRFSTGDLAKMVSSIYADKQNMSLPIGWVVVGCLAVQRGQVDKDAGFMALRKHLAAVSEKLATASGKEDGVSMSELDPVKVMGALSKQ